MVSIALAGLFAFAVGSALARLKGSVRAWSGRQSRVRRRDRRARRTEDLTARLAGELAIALAAGCRPVEALDRCTRHRAGTVSLRGAGAVRDIRRGVDPLLALSRAQESAQTPSEAAVYAALVSELRNGLPAAPGIAAIFRGATARLRTAEVERAARAAPLVQLIVALGLVPSALLIGAAVLSAGLGSGQ